MVSDPGSLRSFWSSAAMVLVGVDHAPQVARLGLARRAEVYLLGEADTSAEAYQWSMPLGAAVITLPDHAEWLSDALVDLGEPRTESGRVVGVIGGSGGVGASTLAAGLAFTAAREWERSMLLDADRYGGGIDLLLGAERVDGWRWPRLARASGHLGDLGGQLPTVDGIDVLAMARTGHPPGWELPAEPLRAVLGSARRGYELTDRRSARGAPDRPSQEVLRLADLVVLVLRDDLRGRGGGPRVARRDRGVAVRGGSGAASEPVADAQCHGGGRGSRAAVARHARRRPRAGRGRRARRPSRPVGAQPAGPALPGAAAGAGRRAPGRVARGCGHDHRIGGRRPRPDPGSAGRAGSVADPGRCRHRDARRGLGAHRRLGDRDGRGAPPAQRGRRARSTRCFASRG